MQSLNPSQLQSESPEKCSIASSTQHCSAHLLSYLGKPTDLVAAFDKIKSQLGHPEVLIYNAGPGGMSWPPPSKAPIPLRNAHFLCAMQIAVSLTLMTLSTALLRLRSCWGMLLLCLAHCTCSFNCCVLSAEPKTCHQKSTFCFSTSCYACSQLR